MAGAASDPAAALTVRASRARVEGVARSACREREGEGGGREQAEGVHAREYRSARAAAPSDQQPWPQTVVTELLHMSSHCMVQQKLSLAQIAITHGLHPLLSGPPSVHSS